MSIRNLNKITSQLKTDHPRLFIYLRSYDLGLDPMTLMLDLDLDIVKMHLCTRMMFPN